MNNMNKPQLNEKNKNEWNTHWNEVNKKTSLFGKILEMYRKIIIANSVRHYIDKYFPKKGVFVEMGSGTSQTSVKINKQKRTLVALDISKEALKEAKKIKNIDKTVNADIFNTGLKDNSIDGIWNLGVMEHFTEKDIVRILNEFYRVTKKGSYVLLWWPPVYGSSEITLGIVEKVANFFNNILKKPKLHFFPGEITRYTTKKRINKIIKKTKLTLVRTHFNIIDLFTQVLVVCKKE